MTYYHEEVRRIREQCFPKLYITDHLTKARVFMDENFCGNIDLKTISESSFLSKFHLIRLFKRCYGMTPHRYIIEKRLELAKKLLRSNRTVMETCFHIGLDSPNSFASTFKKYTGLSPTGYKKQFSIRLTS